MTTKDIEVTRVYSGSFTWDESELRKGIAQFDMHFTVPYCPTDPRTWPLVQSVTRDIRKNKVLPSRVVYSMAFMNSQRLVTLRKLSYSELFRRYPFNFTPGGELRKSEGIPYLEFKKWMEDFGKSSVSPSNAIVPSPTLAEALPGAEGSSSESKDF